MITIQNTIQVDTLLLTWQSNKDRNQRYLVGVIKKLNSDFEFSYLTGTQDYQLAIEQGFLGYPAFPLNKAPFSNDVMATFMKRLPPRSRRDFRKFLVSHHLPEYFDGSDFDLIAHTGIQLPSDGFNLIPNLDESGIPFDYLMESAGTRYHLSHDNVSKLELGTTVTLECDNDNLYDCHAISMKIDDVTLGYVNKLFCPTIRKLMSRELVCSIAKISGTPERPLIYVMLSVK